MFKILILSMLVFSCANIQKQETIKTPQDSDYYEIIEVDSAMCDTDSDCVEKFGCSGIYAESHRVDYACSQWDEN